MLILLANADHYLTTLSVIMKTRDESVELLNRYIENENLRRHCRMVAAAMEGYAHKLEKFREEIEAWWTAGLLHDLGKMRLDQDILNKPGRLTPDEYEHVKLHTVHGYEMIKDDKDVPEAVADVGQRAAAEAGAAVVLRDGLVA